MRNRLMHDGLSLTIQNAIKRHEKEAAAVETNFQQLSPAQKRQLLTFLTSL